MSRASKIRTHLSKKFYEAKQLVHVQTADSCKARRLDKFAGYEDPKASGTEYYCRPPDAPGGSHKRLSLLTTASCGAPA